MSPLQKKRLKKLLDETGDYDEIVKQMEINDPEGT